MPKNKVFSSPGDRKGTPRLIILMGMMASLDSDRTIRRSCSQVSWQRRLAVRLTHSCPKSIRHVWTFPRNCQLVADLLRVGLMDFGLWRRRHHGLCRLGDTITEHTNGWCQAWLAGDLNLFSWYTTGHAWLATVGYRQVPKWTQNVSSSRHGNYL